MSIATSIYNSARATGTLIRSYLGGDSKEDLVPTVSDTYNVASADHNKIVAGLSEVAARTISGNLINVHFGIGDLTDSQTLQPLYRLSAYDTDMLYWVAPCAGWIAGMSISVEAVCSAGTLDIFLDNGGTQSDLTMQIEAVTNTQFHYAFQNSYDAGTDDAFSAGDQIQCLYTSSALWAAGTTPSVNVDLILALGV